MNSDLSQNLLVRDLNMVPQCNFGPSIFFRLIETTTRGKQMLEKLPLAQRGGMMLTYFLQHCEIIII